jgi:hypothetical protein
MVALRSWVRVWMLNMSAHSPSIRRRRSMAQAVETGDIVDSSCRLTWSANKDLMYAIKIFIGHVWDPCNFHVQVLPVSWSCWYQIRIHAFNWSETSVDLCIRLRFGRPLADCAFRGLMSNELMGHVFTRNCNAVDSKGYYKLQGTQSLRVSLADVAQTGFQRFFHKVFICCLEICVPCIFIYSSFINQQMHKVWCLHFSPPYYTPTCFDE